MCFRVPYPSDLQFAVVDGTVYKLYPEPPNDNKTMYCPLDCGKCFTDVKMLKRHIRTDHSMYSFSVKCRGDGATPETLNATRAESIDIKKHCQKCKFLKKETEERSYFTHVLYPKAGPLDYSKDLFSVRIFISLIY